MIETALSVEFAPLAGWTGADFGLFFHEIMGEYPSTEVQAPIISMVEKFGQERWQRPHVEFELIQGEPPVRYWFKNEAEGTLIQLQRDRFIHNWQKVGDRPYPRYAQTRTMFRDAWGRFLAFLTARGIAAPDVRQCEVTYVNQIERGEGWDSPADAARVTTLLQEHSGRFLPPPEVLAVDSRYVIPPERGRLRVTMQPALRGKDQKEILQLQLTARGGPRSSSTDDVLGWLDLGHEWVVRGFVDVTSPAMHNRWGMRGA